MLFLPLTATDACAGIGHVAHHVRRDQKGCWTLFSNDAASKRDVMADKTVHLAMNELS